MGDKSRTESGTLIMKRTMRQTRYRAKAALVFAVLLWSHAAPAEQEVIAVNSLVGGALDACTRQPAQACVDLGWSFVGLPPSDGLTAAHLTEARRILGVWFEASQTLIPARARTMVGLGMLMFDGRGADRLIAGFDSNGDGTVTQRELLADVRLDDRPMSQVIVDPDAVDRDGLAQRLELPPGMLQGMFQ